MIVEKSSGVIIVLKKDGEIFYLLLCDGLGYWGFSKGHVEKGETLEETARREAAEETGLKKIQLKPGFKKWIRYVFQRRGQKIFKLVCFFLGEVKTEKITLSAEHTEYRWLPYQQASKLLSFKNTKLLLKEAQAFLDSQNDKACF